MEHTEPELDTARRESWAANNEWHHTRWALARAWGRIERSHMQWCFRTRHPSVGHRVGPSHSGIR